MSLGSKLSQRLVAEAVGTFAFVLVGAGSSTIAASLGVTEPAASQVLSALGNGLGLAVAVSVTMGISGGVLNPALALGLASAGKLSYHDVIPYMMAELVGAWVAGVALASTIPESVWKPVHLGSPSLQSLTVPQGIGLEALLTFVLMLAVYGTAVDPRGPKVGGLFIGVAVVADVLVGGSLTGAAMNPARAMGPMLASGFIPSYWYIYWVGPVLGAVVAALVYKFALEKKA